MLLKWLPLSVSTFSKSSYAPCESFLKSNVVQYHHKQSATNTIQNKMIHLDETNTRQYKTNNTTLIVLKNKTDWCSDGLFICLRTSPNWQVKKKISYDPSYPRFDQTLFFMFRKMDHCFLLALPVFGIGHPSPTALPAYSGWGVTHILSFWQDRTVTHSKLLTGWEASPWLQPNTMWHEFAEFNKMTKTGGKTTAQHFGTWGRYSECCVTSALLPILQF